MTIRTTWGLRYACAFAVTLFASPVCAQYGPSCVYSTVAPSPAVPSAGGTITLAANGARYDLYWDLPCLWVASSRVEWIRVSRGIGLGRGTFDLIIAPNTGPYVRFGAVTLEDKTIFVPQLGTRPVRNIELGVGPGADPVLYNTVSGQFSAFSLSRDGSGASIRTVLSLPLWGPNRSVAPADFNGDGLTDFFKYDGATGLCEITWSTYPGGVAARHSGGTVCDNGPLNAHPTIFDMDGDGLSDVLLYDAASGAWSLKMGPLGIDAAVGIWAPGWRVSVGRFDADDRDDLFIYNPDAADPNGGRWFQVLSRDNGTFEYIEGGLRWAPGWTVVPGDFDGDGQSELFLYGAGGTGYWFIVDFRPEGTAYFGGQLWAPGWEVHAADFNGDSITDLFLYQNGAGPLQGMWFRVLSTGAYDFDYVQGDMRWAGGWRVSIADLDGDGVSDVFLDGRSDGIAAQVLTRADGHASEYAYDMTWPVADTILLPRRITP